MELFCDLSLVVCYLSCACTAAVCLHGREASLRFMSAVHVQTAVFGVAAAAAVKLQFPLVKSRGGVTSVQLPDAMSEQPQPVAPSFPPSTCTLSNVMFWQGLLGKQTRLPVPLEWTKVRFRKTMSRISVQTPFGAVEHPAFAPPDW